MGHNDKGDGNKNMADDEYAEPCGAVISADMAILFIAGGAVFHRF